MEIVQLEAKRAAVEANDRQLSFPDALADPTIGAADPVGGIPECEQAPRFLIGFVIANIGELLDYTPLQCACARACSVASFENNEPLVSSGFQRLRG